ncbi:MAG: hypothetical protein K2N36_03560, partial [Ruminiclostridium sp.]|nr:hypothetical protein [Ruminiclostridium sp.]
MKIKKVISSILLCTILTGCSNSTTLPEPPSNSPIPNLRTGMGTARQGIKTTGFECTDTGSYFMCNVGSNSWLLYADHGSDTVIKLCGRPDCNHSDNDCNAYFGSATDICYYDGFLYTYDIGSGDILRMNLDGTERV